MKAKGSHHRIRLETDTGNEMRIWEGGQPEVCPLSLAEFRCIQPKRASVENFCAVKGQMR